MKAEECDSFCIDAYYEFASDEDLSDCIENLTDKEFVFDSDEQLQRYLDLLTRANNNTRMSLLRGHTPMEIRRLMPPPKPGRMPTVVPMSSMAADMLEESKDQLKAMGIPVDLNATAASVSTASLPNGPGGKMVTRAKKIYPNDPCPCGSGKKYKKCCGRNVQ